MILTTDR